MSPLLREEDSVDEEAAAGGLGLGLPAYNFPLLGGGGGVVVAVVTAVQTLLWLRFSCEFEPVVVVEGEEEEDEKSSSPLP